jgi:hypothetical protein
LASVIVGRVPPPVGGRTGLRARAGRPHLQTAGPVEPGQRAAAGRDRMDVEHRHQHLTPVHLAAHAPHRFAVFDQRDVRARPTHVERHDVGEAGRCGNDTAGCDDAGGRSAEDRLHAAVRRRIKGCDAAVRQHDVALTRRHAEFVECGAERDDVALDERVQIGVDDRR